LARSAIQAGLLLNGVAAITLLMFMAIFISSPDRVSSIDLWSGLFSSSASASFSPEPLSWTPRTRSPQAKTTAIGTLMRRLGLGLIAGSLLLFLAGLITTVSAI
jgi:hypothetical protein